ncbi:transglycosylase domain-containing protein [Paenibacillus sp. J2TS4]|uniref:transglycosylase domain-containing protein n=1 Tax=Paenibacillus sp. J2TS4 TaxID=2807194 RepID=UPI001B1C1298|nr:PBP1A family penicillin-binding protein [Paenibacillus sp. J2TS4]GIP32580.1 penicillin-binding protein 1F [Paenibacillus sp. J2TS4]
MTSKKKAKTKPKKRVFTWKKMTAVSLVTAALAIVVALAGYLIIIYMGKNILDEQANKLQLTEGSVVLDADGNEVAKLYNRENRELVSKDDIPKLVTGAFIATEDRRFTEHTGIDLWAIGRALVKDVIARKAVEGGSTITQQLAKNMFLSADKTVFRKATEVSIAIALEERFTKDQIMEMYLNRIYFGSGAWGIKLASYRYFGISDLNDLELWQIATLAALPKAPTTYSPINNPEKSKERRGVVLTLMNQQGLITTEQMNEAKEVDYDPSMAKEIQTDNKFPTYIDYVLLEANKLYGIDEEELLLGGYRIQTTLNANAQSIMEETFKNDNLFQPKTDKQTQAMQGSMVILDNETGGIVAMIGGRDYERKGWNRAVIKQQPGSAFKPIISFAPAIESGKFTPYSMLKDEKMSFNGYSPNNLSGKYRGEVTMFDAIKYSWNMPAVWLLNEVGLKNAMNFASGLGITFDEKDRNLAIALGGMTYGVSPLELAHAYSAFANDGIQHEAHAIVSIKDRAGKEIAAFKGEKGKRVMKESTARAMTSLMQKVVEPGGTGAKAAMNRPVAGKTGSTQHPFVDKRDKDIWFAGYTPEWTAAVWMGFDKADKDHYVTISSGQPAAIFKEVMSKALDKSKYPIKPFPNSKVEEEPPVEEEKPDAVTDFNAQYDDKSRTVRMSWQPLDGNVDYKIYRKGSKEADFSFLLQVKSAEANDISAFPGESYQYYVEAYNPEKDTAGDKSNVVEVHIPDENGEQSPSPSPTPDPSESPDPGDDKHPSPSPSSKPNPSPGHTPDPGHSPNPSVTPSPSPTPDPDQGANEPAPDPSSPASTKKPEETPVDDPIPEGPETEEDGENADN